MMSQTDEQKSRKKTLLTMKLAAGALLALLLGLVYYLQRIPEPLSEIQLTEFQLPSESYRKPPPEFQWHDSTGLTKSPKDYLGKVAVLVLWAHWCAPCLKEIPTLQQLFGRLADPDLEMIGINTDKDATDRKSALDFWRTEGIEFGIGFLNENAAAPEQIPTTYVLDRDGQLVFESHEALDWGTPEAEAFLRRLISSHEEQDSDAEVEPSDSE